MVFFQINNIFVKNNFNFMKILGMGNALVDVLARIKDDSLLKQLQLPKGSMQLIDEEKRAHIFKEIANLEISMATGGSVSNTCLALAKLGNEAGFIGKVGNDTYGNFYLKEIKEAGVVAHLSIEDAPSGTAMTLISPDGERTFGTYLGVSAQLNKDDLDASIFKNYDYLYLEGYLVQNYELVEEALKLAKSLKIKIATDLSSYNVVEDNREFLLKMIQQYVDIVFANEEEARALTGKNSEEAIVEIAKMVDIAIVKIGERGSLIAQGEKTIKVPALKVKMLDATAAGDFFTAGFFYGLSQKVSLEKCAQIGTLLAANVIQTVGTKLPDNNWIQIKSDIKAIIL
ncbi:adenosine kinase [Bacteroidales bacterium]|nr:adenosine kinase [Bacteroidales bacterium]